ncbi:MAG: hypothetical protein GY933_00175 [Hyphomicrobiales bacterium]|nr:hypothetical protein [Hyphomicrobiales bacterium]
MALLHTSDFNQPSTSGGVPLAGAKLYFYEEGTTTPITVYQEKALSTPHASPVVADASGIFAPVWIDTATNSTYKTVLTTSADVTVRTVDGIVTPLIAGAAALTSPAVGDKLPIVDVSDSDANKVITLENLWKIQTSLTAETDLAVGDEFGFYDLTAAAARKVTLSNIFKGLDTLTEITSIDAAADFVPLYDTDAAVVGKVKPELFGNTTKTLTFIIDGGGAAITTGVAGYVEIPFACTITAARALADQSGSIVVDIWKDTYANYPPTDADSITASAPVTITTATKSEDTTLTGWTTSITAANILGFNVDSVTDIELLTVSITVTLP